MPLQVSGAVALTVISWPGLLYSFEQKERSLYFETFLKFLGAFRSLNNYKLRILVGGLYNVDLKVTMINSMILTSLKVTQFWRFPDLIPLIYCNRPNPSERKELKCSFVYTKDTLKVIVSPTKYSIELKLLETTILNITCLRWWSTRCKRLEIR